MTKDWLLTENEAKGIILKGWCSPETKVSDICLEPWIEEITEAQAAKMLRALRPIVEYAARLPCENIPWRLMKTQGYKDCGHCATCLARVVLAEFDAQGKGKEG